MAIAIGFALFVPLNILFVANRFPYPPFRGDKLKIYNLTKRLSERHNLYLVTFYEKREELEYLKEISPFFKDIELVYLPKWRSVLNGIPALFSSIPLQLAYFRHGKMHKKVKNVLARYSIDVVHTQHLRMSQYTKHLSHPKILDLPDAFSLYFKRRNETDRALLHKVIDKIEIGRLVKAEGVITKYDKTLVCSREDKAYLEKLHKTDNVDLLLNGVDLSTFDVKEGHNYKSNNVVLFTGNMDYAPNVDAVTYFVKEIWPSVSSAHPQAKFVIAGQRPVEQVLKLAANNIEVTGFIPDLQEMYAMATVLVSPLRFGAGTQNKVLESMAMGVPVVCTNIGFEGLQIKSGEGVIMAKDKTAFTKELDQLLSDQELRKKVGEKGLAVAKNRFSWDKISVVLENFFEELA